MTEFRMFYCCIWMVKYVLLHTSFSLNRPSSVKRPFIKYYTVKILYHHHVTKLKFGRKLFGYLTQIFGLTHEIVCSTTRSCDTYTKGYFSQVKISGHSRKVQMKRFGPNFLFGRKKRGKIFCRHYSQSFFHM